MANQVSTTVELVYDLCPHSRYFALPIPEQADAMGVLLRKLVALAGPGQAGVDFLEQWATFPTPPRLDGHYLSEASAWVFAQERLAELPPQATPYSLTAGDCRNCIPRPPLHLTQHMFQIETTPGQALTINAPSSLGQIVCNVYLHLTVATPLQAHAMPGEPGHGEMRMGRRTKPKTVKSQGSRRKQRVR